MVAIFIATMKTAAIKYKKGDGDNKYEPYNFSKQNQYPLLLIRKNNSLFLGFVNGYFAGIRTPTSPGH